MGKWRWICWFIKLISFGNDRAQRNLHELLRKIAIETNEVNDRWERVSTFPKQSPAHVGRAVCASQLHRDAKTAVVMQGPLIDQDERTLETLRYYRRTMPQAEVILSTWDNLADVARRQAEALGVRVVKSELPADRGPQNVNCQLLSTARGMQLASELGCKFAMKTRTDVRIHLLEADKFCRNLLSKFPLQENLGQTQRIVTLDFATRMFIPNHLADIFMFGEMSDMAAYWSEGLFGPDLPFHVPDQFGEFLEQPIPEVLLCERYLHHLGADIAVEIDDWWSLLATRFLVVDREMLGHVWPKYSYNMTQQDEFEYNKTNMALCQFANWLQLHSGNYQPHVSRDELVSQRLYTPLSSHAA